MLLACHDPLDRFLMASSSRAYMSVSVKNPGGNAVSNLVDVESVPVIDVWGEAVRARRIEGERITLALVELAPDAVVPGHQHEAEQLGMVVEGSVVFTIGDERRELGPGGTWRIPSMIPHQVTTGPRGATVIDIFSPTRADWDALPATPPRPGIRWPVHDGT
jgi:quercetin dioxygenase-like cupin family protein